MNDQMSMAELMEQYSGTDKISKGDVVSGKIISIGANDAIVNIGYMADGVLPKTEVSEEEWETLKIDDIVNVLILKSDDGEGNVLLSLSKAYEIVVWEELKKNLDNKRPFLIKIKEVVKGGVVGIYRTARVFVPASQLSLSYLEDLSPFVNQKIEVQLIELDVEKKKVVASHKEILKVSEEKKKKNQISTLKEGDILSGTVTRLAKYGAFVDLGHIDGLVHISHLSWKRVKDPSEVVKEGDVVEVTVLSVDIEQGKVALKLNDVMEDPWSTVESRYEIESVVKGIVTRIAPFGAFVEIEDGIEGLVHISELSEHRIQKATEVVQINQEVDVMILSIDSASRQMSLSIKEAAAIAGQDFDPEFLSSEENSSATLSDLFGDKLKGLKF